MAVLGADCPKAGRPLIGGKSRDIARRTSAVVACGRWCHPGPGLPDRSRMWHVTRVVAASVVPCLAALSAPFRGWCRSTSTNNADATQAYPGRQYPGMAMCERSHPGSPNPGMPGTFAGMDAQKALAKRGAMAVTEHHGVWDIELTWPADADQGNPWQITIRPADSATTEDVFGGIPSTLLRRIDVAEAVTRLREVHGQAGELRKVVNGMAERLAAVARRGLVDDVYLATLAAAYVALVQLGSPSVIGALADMSGKAQETIRIHLKRARAAGLLTTGAAGRAGGQLTDKAKGILGP